MFWSCFETFFKLLLKLLLFTFYFNGGLHAVSIRKLSQWMSNFWTVWFLKTECEPNFGFLYIPTEDTVKSQQYISDLP